MKDIGIKNSYIVRKTYQSFVVASILTSLTATVGILIDNIIVGHFLGSAALGAMGIVGPVSLIFSALGNLCSGGGATRAAQALGKGDRHQVNVIFSANVLFVMVTGILITATGLLFTPEITALLGADGALYEPSESYLSGYFIGTIPTIMLSAMMSFIRIDGSPKLPLVCMAVMSGANILLDLVMVLVFHQGMFGMALATSISYCLAVATACTHFLKKDSTLKLVAPKGFFSEMGKTIATGLPTAISRISDTVNILVLNNLMVAFVSVGAVTALNVRMQANSFIYAIIIGIAQAATPTIGMFFGEEDRTAMRDTLKITLKLGLCINVLLMVLFLAVPGVFSALLGVDDPEILTMSNTALRFFAIGLPIAFINTVLMNFYQCTGRVRLSLAICILQSLVFTIVFAFLLIQPMGSTGVWTAFLLGEVLTLLAATGYIVLRSRKVSVSLGAIMMLDRGFGGDPEDRLELSIGNSMEEVMNISSGIHKFAKGRQMDEKMVNALALTVEEMAGNVVQHCFEAGQNRWMDLTVIDKPDRVIVRLRDNGAAFDPLAYMAEHRDSEHIGIRLIHSLSADFEYKRAMGLNNLIIHFKKE